jgi:glucose/arabinose dehydrogenase
MYRWCILVDRRSFLKLLAGLTLLGGLAGLLVYRFRGGGSPRVDVRVLEELFEPVTLVEGLEVPWSIGVLEDGSMYVTERPGRLVYVSRGSKNVIASITVANVGEAGLLGLAVHPERSYEVYLYSTHEVGGYFVNRVSRVKVNTSKGYISDAKIVVDGIPGAVIHDGGRLRFGPDGMLYITTGDAARPELSQDLGSLAGKILRIEDDGSIPHDNPFPDNPIYSYGHRNPQGIDWHPPSGMLFSTEHGPVGRDELNIIKPGGNYGWPYVAGIGGSDKYLDPAIDFGPTSIAPSGSSFATTGPKEVLNHLFIACLRGEGLVNVGVDPDGNVLGYSMLYKNVYGRLRDVVPHPEGGLLVSTSNRDGRGTPRKGDDKIIHLKPL